MTRQFQLMQEALNLMPQGVAENYRFWGDRTIFVDNAKGCTITDCSGNQYIDFRLGYGPIILGYCDPRINEAVIKNMTNICTLTGFATPLEIEVAKQLKKMCPSIEKIRYANSGTEAVMAAIRTARAYTKRSRVVIFEGCFHGLYDELMWKSDLENWDYNITTAPNIVPFGAGTPDNSKNLIDILSFNDFDQIENIFTEKGSEIACVLLEPIIGNAGSLAADTKWLQLVRNLCTKYGSLLIIDEVKSGFRVAKGGAQELYNIYGDISVYAKAIANGFPIAIFGGKANIMDCIGSFKGGVSHGGTYTANIIGLSAAYTTMKILDETDAFDVIMETGNKIIEILKKVFTKANIPHIITGPSSMFGIHFTEKMPEKYRDWKRTKHSLYEKFAWNLIDNGILVEPDSREPWFICESHKSIDLVLFEKVCEKAIFSAIND